MTMTVITDDTGTPLALVGERLFSDASDEVEEQDEDKYFAETVASALGIEAVATGTTVRAAVEGGGAPTLSPPPDWSDEEERAYSDLKEGARWR